MIESRDITVPRKTVFPAGSGKFDKKALVAAPKAVCQDQDSEFTPDRKREIVIRLIEYIKAS